MNVLFLIHRFVLVVEQVKVNSFSCISFPILSPLGVTHTEITQVAFLRSLGRYLLETKAIQKYEINNREYNIDELYRLTYPHWSNEKLHIHSYPLKSILDTILVENAMVDMDRWTKKLPAAHFDSEAFRNASRRMIKIRQISNLSLSTIRILIIMSVCSYQ